MSKRTLDSFDIASAWNKSAKEAFKDYDLGTLRYQNQPIEPEEEQMSKEPTVPQPDEKPALKHDGGYTVSETGMLKHTGGKLRMECLPPEWKELLAKHMAYGAFEKKPKPYGLANWKKGGKASLLIAALERHLLAFQKGENIDSESGSHHLVAAACNALMLVVLQSEGKLQDDRK